LAMRLRCGLLAERGVVVCSVGTRDRQDSMLARIGLAPVPAMDPVACDDFNDKVRMMYCSNSQQLHPRFLRMMDEMAKTLGLARALSEIQPDAALGQGASVHGGRDAETVNAMRAP